MSTRLAAPRMSLFAPSDPRPVHFMGAAGAGMSALAELLARRGVRVTGCDANPATVADLERLGITVSQGHDAAHVDGARAVVVTSAVPRDHPELEAAREKGIPVIRRAEALAEAVSVGEVVAVAGTHGKTTTTVMTTEALGAAGLEPTGIVGGRVAAWNGNLSEGSDRLFVVEADEYDRSFLALAPTVAVVTSIEADHLDIYRDLTDIRVTFARFARDARAIVLCADDAGANALPTPPTAEVVRYGISSTDARLVAREVTPEPEGGSTYVPVYDGKVLPRVRLAVPGRHNVLNSLAALASGLVLGANAEGLARGLANFRGVERRFQRVGEASGVLVIDDYAHHPTEIRATLAAARVALPGRRLVVAFQPHLYSRTRDFAPQFGAALAQADEIFLTEIYPAREQPIPGVSSSLIEDAIAGVARGASVETHPSAGAPAPPAGRLAWRGERRELAAALAGAVRSGDVVITLGAGDITRTGPELLAHLTAAA
ncbi:MAG TPA: UDP-N-acetylmuramate--L-alanine ligase [Gemmatimonadaceae bacterium]|nr:UDP-N-acetylmuramate--L-alanine ligase [Gemmatimonadaceae bacterium]